MIQQSLTKSGIDKWRTTAMGWQTIAKTVERAVNSVPLSYLYHRRDGVRSILQILTPNMLKLSTNSEIAPKGMFTVPDLEGLTGRIRDIYNLWYKVWAEEYLPINLFC